MRSFATRRGNGSRARARAWAFLTASAVVGAVGVLPMSACTEALRSVGEDCLKSPDCLSGVCSGLKCVAAPVLLDGSPDNTAPPPPVDAGADTADSAPADDGSLADADEGG